jgi:hypothetical protein
MSFMEPQVVKDRWYKCDTDNGIEFVPWDVVCDDTSKLWEFVSGKLEKFELIEGWGARLSAPGYLDCTDWCVFDTEQEAVDYLAEEYGEELEEEEESKES